MQFILPNTEPVGEHRLWIKWAFYNPYAGINTCQYDVDCLGPATIDGKENPFFWSKYTLLTDYFSEEQLDWTVTVYWIRTALSVFGIFGWPLSTAIGIYQFWYFVFTSIDSYNDFRNFHYIE